MIIPKNITDFNNLKRYFKVAGLITTVLAGILLVAIYRYIATSEIIELGERNNLILAETVLNSVKGDLIDYIENTKSSNPATYKLPPKLDEAIQNTMANTSVSRVTIFNKHGTVVFSTRPSQIGKDENNNAEYKSAMSGTVASKFIYHDTLSFFRDKTDDDNLVQSYLPIRSTATSPIYGVFEIYTDVEFIVEQVFHTEVMIALSVIIILTLLYNFLLLIVQRSSDTIEEQQSTIQERTKALELMSAQMLNIQENERKRLSKYLHEDVAQTLSLVKNQIEEECLTKLDNGQNASQQTLEYLYNAIQEIKRLAMELRPPLLDDLGVIKTIEWLCSEYHTIYPNLTINSVFEVEEEEIPANIKIVMYRIIQEILVSITKKSGIDSIIIKAYKDNNTLILRIEDTESAYHASESPSIQDAITGALLSSVTERTILSGGRFSITNNKHGVTAAMASWDI